MSDYILKVSLENGDTKAKAVFFRNTFQPVKYGKIEKYFPIGTVVTVEYKGYDAAKNREEWHVTSIVK